MSMSLEFILIGASILLLLSVLTSKVSDRFGVPALLLFLALGMLAGSDGPGGFYFDNPALAQYIGVVALVLILFSGGLDTSWTRIRPVLWEGISLASIGVVITALVVGGAAYFLLGFPLLESLLLGSIVSSTDAAAVFSVLRAKGVSLRGKLTPLLELESGSNDPMAVFLTVGIIQLLTRPGVSPLQLIPQFFVQMILGAAIGYTIGSLAVIVMNRIKLSYDGLYPVLTLAFVFLTYGAASSAGGSGFLAVYLAGIVMGNRDFVHKRSLMRFYDGIAWLMQITMFLTLGLLVFPSRLVHITGPGLLIAFILLVIARPVGVFASLAFARLSLREKVFVAWIGLRGATPIILATYPLLAGINLAEQIFNLVFFVVLTSVLLQGPSIPFVARLLRLEAPIVPQRVFPIEANPDYSYRNQLKEVSIPSGSPFVGKAIVELGLPAEFLVILIARDNDFFIPNGSTVLQSGDMLLALSDEGSLAQVQKRVVNGSTSATDTVG